MPQELPGKCRGRPWQVEKLYVEDKPPRRTSLWLWKVTRKVLADVTMHLPVTSVEAQACFQICLGGYVSPPRINGRSSQPQLRGVFAQVTAAAFPVVLNLILGY